MSGQGGKSKYCFNESLPIIKRDWRGNRKVSGCFSNLYRSQGHGILSVAQWRFSPNPDWKEKIMERWRPKPNMVESLDEIVGDALFWIGHSSFYIQIGGKRMLIDPIFGRIPFVRRRSPLPMHVNIFKNIDYILISHDHYDHLDRKSVKQLLRLNPKVKVICGLDVGELISKWSRRTQIVEMGWYQQLSEDGVKLTFLPAQHWGKRTATDGGTRLWGAFMIESDSYRLYFSGDTGYSNHFKELPLLFDKIDCAIMGIGAYKPRWFMRANHISPHQALDAAMVMGANLTIPMHYGTYSLSDEAMGDPPRVFRFEARRRGINVRVPRIGTVVSLERT